MEFGDYRRAGATVHYQPSFLRRCFSVTTGVALCLAMVGCSSGPETEVDKLVVLSGGGQCGLAGDECAKPLVLEVMGPQRPGLLGGKGRRRPVAGVTVRFEPVQSETMAELVGSPEVETDAAGIARVHVRLAKAFGDQYVRGSLPQHPDLSATVRFTSGLQVLGGKQEAMAGELLPQPVTLVVTDGEQEPVAGVPVYFRLVSQPGKKGKLKVLTSVTDAEGMAQAQVQTDAKATGTYELLAEVADPEGGYSSRGVLIKAMALNRLQLLIGVLGGLGVFILGMKFMSDGLQQVAGARLKSLLHFFTRNRFAAVAAGAGVTGLIQSSSACTVMVVGFVNAGLLSLRQAIGIVYGANIGTTVTGQMVSLKLDGLALPAIAIGVAMSLLAKRSTTRHIAQTLFGFGLLFFGMKLMSGQLKSIAGFPSFVDVFQRFDCRPGPSGVMPIGAVLGAVAIGTAMTMIVQSSSATIGLTIALAASGLINFHTAVPLILGDNIGTTVTALLASIGTNARARQAAIAHTIFNLAGALYMVLLLYVTIGGVPIFMHIVDLITAGDVFAVLPENIGRHVASAHTLFNVGNVLLFLPLLPVVARICESVVRAKSEEAVQVQKLEPHLLATPAVALTQAVDTAIVMLETAWGCTSDAFSAVKKRKVRNEESLLRREQSIDRLQMEITEYLVRITQRELTENQAETVPLLIHCVNDAERVGDLATNILELAKRAEDKKVQFSKAAAAELDEIFESVAEQAHHTIQSLQSDSRESVDRALELEQKINALRGKFDKSHVKRLERGKCDVLSGLIFGDVIGNLERIGDHLSNIAERTPELQKHRVEL